MGVLQPIIVVFALLVGTVCAYQANKCYHCTNNPSGDLTHADYDEHCGDRNYDGDHTIDTSNYEDRCCTTIWANGYISRTSFNKDTGEGGCYYRNDAYGERMSCVCYSEDLCNTGSYCEQCSFPFPTSHPEPTTTEVVTTPSDSLQCYSCYDCPDVDENTQIIYIPDADSCVTTIFLDSGIILRGGTPDHMVDGECLQNNGEFPSLSCWCNSPLCNSQATPQILELQ